MSVCLLTGCGVSGNNTLVAVKFAVPVFYVDANCETALDFKAYPATATNYNVNLIPDHERGYELKNGVIKITDSMTFSPLTLTLQCGSLQDVCYVVKKSYPSRICLYHNDLGDVDLASDAAYSQYNVKEITLLAGSSTQLTMFGEFTSYFDQEQGKMVNYNSIDRYHEVSPEIFSFRMASSDPTIVRPSDDNKSLTITAGDKTGTAEISACLINSNGEDVSLSSYGSFSSFAKIRVNVVNPCSAAMVNCANKILKPSKNGNQLVFNLGIDNLPKTEQVLKLYLIDSKNNFIESPLVLSSTRISVVGNNLAPDNQTQSKSLSVNGEPIIVTTNNSLSHFNITIRNSSDASVNFDSTDKILVTSRYLDNENFEPITIILNLY